MNKSSILITLEKLLEETKKKKDKIHTVYYSRSEEWQESQKGNEYYGKCYYLWKLEESLEETIIWMKDCIKNKV